MKSKSKKFKNYQESPNNFHIDSVQKAQSSIKKKGKANEDEGCWMLGGLGADDVMGKKRKQEMIKKEA